MIVTKMYAHGSGYKVRVEHHLSCCPDGTCSQSDEDATERAYPPRGSSPGETLQHLNKAAGRAMGAWSRARLVESLCYQERLPGL